MIESLPVNMRSKISVTPDGCWQWTAALNSKGYGSFNIDKVGKSTHRVVYELLVGPIPDGLQLDHLCRNKRCCNPAHLDPVTAAENARRRPDVHKTHCVHGHELTPENTVVKARPNGRSIRNCRTCGNAQRRKAA